jgi:hypothetical protein
MYDAWGRIRTLISEEDQAKVLSGEYRARIVKYAAFTLISE